MTDVVLDASAAIELLAKSTTGSRLTALLPTQPVFWVPDGAFDVEVNNVLRRWSLRSDIDQRIIADARTDLARNRFRRVSVRRLSDRAWSHRANMSFADACYVALAELLGCPLLTTDMKLVKSPTLPIPTIHPSS